MRVLSDHAAPAQEWSSLVELLRSRASDQPDQQGYTFLLDGDTHEIGLTYATLDQQARQIGALLQRLNIDGARALLLYPPGLDYIAAFFGCLYAGVIAVPAYPPRSNRNLDRLQAIVADAQAAVVLTTSAIAADMERRFAYCPELAALRWVASDGPIDGSAERWQAPQIMPEHLAFLQYTSGSTGTPKGVMLSHRNLLHNSALIQQCFEHTSASRGVSWLPPYHDMGLIGGIIQPLYAGFPVTLMSPVAFLQRPLRWLQAISRTRATTSGGPNFAYDLCVRKIAAEERAGLDLTSWELAVSGAEPVRAETLERFTAAFAPAGFRHTAFYPCYGLAEATLIVTGGAKAAPPTLESVDRAALERHQRVEAPLEHDAAQTLVGCGQTLTAQQIRIIDPETLAACPDDQIGEIWVAGPSVAQGYWNRPEASSATFQARPAGSDDGPFLRTGDLGLLHQGELFVTGRIKDLIIIRGRNHYPQDIELTVERSHVALRPGCGAAFSVEIEGDERLVVVQEVERQQRHGDLAAMIAAIREAVAERHELHLYAVALLKPGSIPKTSSGKIQRHACRSQFLDGSLDLIGSDILDAADSDAQFSSLTRAELLGIDPAQRVELLAAYLQQQVARAVGMAPERIDREQPLIALGLDSLMVAELKHGIENDLGLDLPLATLLQGPSIEHLAQELLSQRPDQARPSVIGTSADTATHPLSHGQQALWFMYQLAPESTTHNLSFATLIRADLNIPALERAFAALVGRHAMLRSSFSTQQRQPVQQISAEARLDFQQHDARGWSQDQLQQWLDIAARQPFDLAQTPLLRVNLLTRSAQEYVLHISMPHIAADFWSMALLMDELGTLYKAEHTGAVAPLAPLPAQYVDYVRWETAMLERAEGEQHWAYWQQQLADAPMTLSLPTDRPRPALQTYNSAAECFTLSAELTQRLKALSEQQQVTLYTTLLTSFQMLLYRYSNQEELLIGSPMLGRSQAEFAGVVGSFAKPVVLRANLADDPSFTTLLAQTRQTVLDALAHQDYPFALLVERLQPLRDPSMAPLFQVMFNFLNIQLHQQKGLAAYGLGISGVPFDLHGLPVESLALDQQIDQFDLTLLLAELEGGLAGSLHYNTDLFDSATIQRMAEHLQLLLEELVSDPQRSLSALVARIHKPKQSVVVSATFTAEPLQESLAFWLEQIELPATIQFAPYNQVFQQLLDPSSPMGRNHDGTNIVLLRLEDWAEIDQSWSADSYERAEQTMHEFLAALQAATQRTAAPYLVGICPLSESTLDDPEPTRFTARMEQLLAEHIAMLNGVYQLDLATAVRRYRVGQVFDPFSNELGRVPFTPECFAAIGSAIARALFALRRTPAKLIAVDCDHTLWDGVCGEDGPHGITIGPAHIALQRFLVEQQQAGMLLCLCTKNNQDDVLDVFRQRPEMPLKLEHIVAQRINWSPKSENLVALAHELNLGLESVIFLDDSPLECAEVQARCPEVLALALPQQPEDRLTLLEHVWSFDHIRITSEDRQRSTLYAAQQQRERLRAEAPTLDDFLAGLDLTITCAPIQPAQLARAAELTQRTNQFNLTTIRRSESELLQLVRAGDRTCWAIDVSDRFGDYGLVGLVIFELTGTTLEVETLLLSCRALGRRVEDTILTRLAQLAEERDCTQIMLRYVPTARNAPALDFLRRSGVALTQEVGGSLCGTIATRAVLDGSARAAVAQPSAAGDETGQQAAVQESLQATQGHQQQNELIVRIASKAQTAEQILELLRAQKRVRPMLESEYVAPRTVVEEVLCDIWADVLGLEQVGVHDNFFELGGHSLLAIQITSRLHDAFQVELPLLTAFFETPTIAGLSTAITQAQGGADDAEKIAQMWQQLEQLSDDEVELLLQERV